MHSDLRASFVETAKGIRERMAMVCEKDPIGPLFVFHETCRTNLDRLTVIDLWIKRIDDAERK